MTGASYPRLALLLQLIYITAIYITQIHAFPAELELEPQSSNDIPIGQNIQMLMDTLAADPDIRYRKSTVVVCYIAVDHGDHDPEHFHDYPLSSNIGDFRDIRCIFRYGGPMAEERESLFQVENRWPLHWDEWEPPGHGFYWPFEVRSFSWRRAVRYMSAERANRLLKARGHRGPYELVSLQITTAHPEGVWCFLNVQLTDAEGGGQRTFIVDVRTGRVEETRYCDGSTSP